MDKTTLSGISFSIIMGLVIGTVAPWPPRPRNLTLRIGLRWLWMRWMSRPSSCRLDTRGPSWQLRRMGRCSNRPVRVIPTVVY